MVMSPHYQCQRGQVAKRLLSVERPSWRLNPGPRPVGCVGCVDVWDAETERPLLRRRATHAYRYL